MRIWRFVAVIFAVIATLVVMHILKPESDAIGFVAAPHIARINIEGMIVDEKEYAEKILKLSENEKVKAAIIHVNSPGGTTVDSDLLYRALRKVAETKPVVTQMHSVAASGGYIVAMASDYIIANGNTITGSIGVIMQTPNFSGLMENIGVEITEIKSSPLKGQPSPYNELSEAAETNIKEMVKDTQDWFLQLVKTRRKMGAVHFEKATNGGIFTGRQAFKIGLVDSLGGEAEALAWLNKHHKIDKDIEIIDINKPKDEPENLFKAIFSSLMGHVFGYVLKNDQEKLLSVDGLHAVWQGI
ncbi:MAG: signal peptide peptidase SppA [Pseudomonadota bacterium]